jgi:hypothetical protein
LIDYVAHSENESLRVFVRSHGEADAAFASRVKVPVAHQNSAIAQRAYKFRVA